MFSLITAIRRLVQGARIGAALYLLSATQGLLFAQTALVNGGNHPGTITVGAIDPYTFNGTAGETVTLRVGATNFAPKIELHGPGGPLLQSAPSAPPSGVIRDTLLSLHLATTGLYTVDVSSYYASGAGTYTLRFAQAPGVFTVPGGDEGGVITNGTRRTGVMDVGDLDMWSFTGNVGDSIQLRVGATNLVPQIDLYGPDGTLVQTAPTAPPSGVIRDAVISQRLTTGGSYTVVVSSYYLANSATTAGTYALSFAQAPGPLQISANDEGGPLTNGKKHSGIIDVGDLDMWSFTANSGDNIQLRVGATNLVPQIDLYGPDGALVQTAPTGPPSGVIRDAVISQRLTTGGAYTVVVSSYYLANSATTAGTYALSFAQAPGPFQTSDGDEGRALSDGAKATGTIDVGDLDLWSFTANAGDSIQLRVGTTNLVPEIDLYGPDGAIVQTVPSAPPAGVNRDASISLRLTKAGSYTVVVSSYYLANSATSPGTYTLSYFKTPGDIVAPPGGGGGALTNGLFQTGTIQPGYFDVWTFAGSAGDNIELRMGATNLVPELDLYAPDGTSIASVPTAPPSGTSREERIMTQLTTSGTFTVVASSYYAANSATDAGTYSLTLVHPPAQVFVSPGDEGGAMTNGYTYTGTNSVGDMDVWSFYGTPGDSNVFRFGTVGFTPWLRLYGPDGKLVNEVFTENANNRTNQMSFIVTNAGNYTLVSSAYYVGQSGTYTLKQARIAPDLIMPATISVNEETPLNIPISAQDPDSPNKALVFALQGQPAGMNILNAGATNATISWSPTEVDGPKTNVFLATVTDVASLTGQPFTRTNTVTVIVNEVNRPPSLTVPADQALNELTPLNVTASATDVDLPANPLTFSLISQPPGMNIDPNSGAISWTPTEEQGPGSYTISVVVTDDSPYAVNAQHLSTTNSFTVTVNEVNTPPQLAKIADQVVDEGKPLSVPASVVDSDLPLNTFTFGIVSGPQGLTIDPGTGLILWTPSEAQGPSTNLVTVKVTDNNPAAVNEKNLSVTTSFNIVVNEVNSAPVLPAIGPQTVNELQTLTVVNTATDSDLPANVLAYSLVGAPGGVAISPSGVITWTPTEAQGPTNVTITTVVTDNGLPPLSVTNSFTVAVSEVNTAPAIADIPAQTATAGVLLTVPTVVTDSDLPPNIVTLTLENAPSGMALDPATGIITWTPADTQAGAYTVTLRATDNGTPVQTTTKTFQVTVTVTTARIAKVTLLSNNRIQLDLVADPSHQYDLEKSTDLKSWDSLIHVPLQQQGTYQFIEGMNSPYRFYRLKQVQ